MIKPGRGVGPGPDHGRRLPSAPRSASTRSSRTTTRRAPPGKAVGLGLGLKNSGLGNGFREVTRASSLPRQRRHGVEVRHGWTEMGQGVHTVALQVAVEELGIDPDAHRGDRRHHPRARLRPDHRQPRHADGRRLGAEGLRRGAGRRLRGRRRLRRRAPSSTGRSKLGDPAIAEPDHPLRVRLRRAAGRRRPRDRRDREGRRRPRRRPGRQPAAVRGPDRGPRAHGPRLRADRGLPRRRDRLPDEHDAAQPRHPARQGRAADRGRAGRGAPAEVAVRHQGRRRDRPRADAPARSPPRCTTSTASGARRCRCAAAGSSDD